jgi:hypothetical protein
MGIAYNTSIVTSGLVFSLDAGNTRCYSGSGLTAYSLVGNLQSDLVGGVGFSSTGTSSFYYDGSNDLINTNYSVSGMSEFTAEASFRTTSTYDTSQYYNCPSILGTAQGAGASGDWCMAVKAGNLVAYDELNGGANNIDLNIYVANNNWYIVQATRDSSGVIKYYVNGVFITQSTGRTTLLRTTATTSTIYGTNWMVGSAFWIDGNYRNFLGNIGYSRLYNRALSAQEISQNFNATRDRYGI